MCLTNLADPDIAFGEALYRGRGRCEPVIRDLKDTGLAHLPSAAFVANEAWLTAVLIAGDLLAWFRGIGLAGALRGATPGPAPLHATACGGAAHPDGASDRGPGGGRVAVERPALVTAVARCAAPPSAP